MLAVIRGHGRIKPEGVAHCEKFLTEQSRKFLFRASEPMKVGRKNGTGRHCEQERNRLKILHEVDQGQPTQKQGVGQVGITERGFRSC
jgi:hypothetical protein